MVDNNGGCRVSDFGSLVPRESLKKILAILAPHLDDTRFWPLEEAWQAASCALKWRAGLPPQPNSPPNNVFRLD
ncbi:hypothetical protein L195_g053543 [Trifolium pratense]|uniref:Uncharacterized protein n=1 Tax=Trifolium pratense TaxID=57577 RepID=A0A2K3KB61_TRIPR|nr:hypothetical protein L195_g053543 [Trifolium pratense]